MGVNCSSADLNAPRQVGSGDDVLNRDLPAGSAIPPALQTAIAWLEGRCTFRRRLRQNGGRTNLTLV